MNLNPMVKQCQMFIVSKLFWLLKEGRQIIDLLVDEYCKTKSMHMVFSIHYYSMCSFAIDMRFWK